MSELRKLDVLIATHVFGTLVELDQITKNWWAEKRSDDPFDYFVAGTNDKIPHYSTDIALAIGVLEKLRAEGWEYCIEGFTLHYRIRLDRPSTPIGKQERGLTYDKNIGLPEAICRHVLHVLGLEVKP